MATALRDVLLDLVADLRAADVRISVAESLDAMRAVAAAGLTRGAMREALRAALIKDQADDATFDEVFASRFDAPSPQPGASRQSAGALIGVSGRGSGGGGAVTPPPRAETPEAASQTPKSPPDSTVEAEPPQPSDARRSPPRATSDREASATQSNPAAAATDADSANDKRDGASQKSHSADRSGDAAQAHAAGRAARIREIERTPFAQYTDLEYDAARDVLALLKRRIRVRLGRRLRFASSGRIDFRRTIRAAIQRGGVMADLRFRARRPRHFDLLVLTDISGSVSYASTLMLELVAGVRELFHLVRCFVYIDRLAEAELQQGHLAMAPALDLYARSDFGRVLAQLLADHLNLLGRATLVVIMGDARNNRRPARADLLRAVASRSRAVIWLNPEPVDRWNSGDSAVSQYAREVDALIPCGNLRELEKALAGIVLG